MKKYDRNIGIDLLKVISMCGIIMLHLIGQGGIINNIIHSNFSHFAILIIYAICFLSVNIFAIISGYLSWNKKDNNNKRIIELILIMFFYSIIITIIFNVFNIANIQNISINKIGFLEFLFNGKQMLDSKYVIFLYSIFPPFLGRYWYITCYVFLFMLMPYINKYIKIISKNEYKKMLLIIFVLLSIIPTLLFNIDFFRINYGYSPFWLIYCYLIGGYLGKYEKSIVIKRKKVIIYFFICIFGSIILNYIYVHSQILFLKYSLNNIRFIDYISPFNILASFCIVFLLKDIEIKSKSIIKVLSCLSINSFSVYIIHSHFLIYDYVIKDSLVFLLDYNPIVVIVFLIFISIFVYLLCIFVDFFRIKIFNLLKK